MSLPPHVRRGRGRGRGTSRGSPSPSGLAQRESKSRPGPTDHVTQDECLSASKESKALGTRERKKPEAPIYVPRPRRHQQGDGNEAEINGDPQTHAEERLHKDRHESSSKASTRDTLGSPSEQRRTKSGRKARPEMQRYVPRARRQPLSESPSGRMSVPESWDDAIESPSDGFPNVVDSPKGSSVKKFKSESTSSDEKFKTGSDVGQSGKELEERLSHSDRRQSLDEPDHQYNSQVSDVSGEKDLSQIGSEIESIPSSTNRTLPDLVLDTVAGSVCSTSSTGVGLVADITHSGQVTTTARYIHDSPDTKSLPNKSEADPSILSGQPCQDLVSASKSHPTINLSSQHSECSQSHPIDLIHPDAEGGSAGPEELWCRPESDVTEEERTLDIVSTIPATSHDSPTQTSAESQRKGGSPVSPQLISQMCDDVSKTTSENVLDSSELTSSVLTVDQTPDSQLVSKICDERDEQSCMVPAGVDCSGSVEKMEEGDSQGEQKMNGVRLQVDDASPSVILDIKTVPDQSESRDFEVESTIRSVVSSSNNIEKDVKETIPKAMNSKERAEIESLELEKQLKAQAIAALDFSEPKTDSQEEEEDSWDKMFDDNGDCLDPSLIVELTSHVGKVQIDKPKIDYLNFQPKEPDIDMEMYGHVIEIYDFPGEFLTRDLIGAFKDFMSRGFDIKWVDDTHALGVFASPIAAQDALTLNHPLLKVRSLTEASRQSKTKAKKNHEFLQPYKARPQTSASAARRLVSGALGLQAQIPREKRELERKQLKEAKEKRRKERRQKQDMWDGSVSKCAMDQEG